MKIVEVQTEYRIYCDLDGVLADFDKGVKDITGKYPHELPLKDMWRQLAHADEFYYRLEWMNDGPQLWEYIKKYDPAILSGLPMGKWAPGQKTKWIGEHLGWDIPAILGMARDKHEQSAENHILIDDREKARAPWEAKGGIFIHHISAANSIAELKKLGL